MSKKINTYVNEEKRVVVSVIVEEDEYGFMHKYTGKAKCSKEDVFDINVGKKLSLARAWLKYDYSELKSIQETKEFLSNMIEDLQNEEIKQNEQIKRTLNKIEELCDSIED